jgi:hypothetical protein
MTTSLSFVFPPDTPTASAVKDVDDAAFTLGACGLNPYFKAFEKSLSPHITVHRWAEDRGEGVIDLTIDTAFPAILLSVMGPDERSVAAAAKELVELLELPSAEDYEREAKTSEDPTALIRAALAHNGGYSEALGETVRVALGSSDTARRRAAAQASALLAWPELGPVLRTAAARESDDQARRLMELAVRKCAA